MSLFLLVLSSAFAKALAPGELPLPQVGAVADLTGCDEMRVLANAWSAKATVKTVVGKAEAERICKKAEGDLGIAKAKAKAIEDASAANAGLVNAAAIPMMMEGGNVSYRYTVLPDGTQTMDLVTGPAAAVHELAAALPQPTGFGNQYGYGAYDADPRQVGLARLIGVPLGAPITTSAQAATAPCGTAEQCQARISALQSALAKK